MRNKDLKYVNIKINEINMGNARVFVGLKERKESAPPRTRE